MSLVHINWRPNARELRKFGLTVLVGFAVIGGIVFFGKPFLGCWLWGIGAMFGILGLTGTVIALPFYFIWMGLAFVMGNIMSRIIMVLVFYLIVTPLGVVMRLTGRDRLKLSKRNVETYWLNAPESESNNYQRQY